MFCLATSTAVFAKSTLCRFLERKLLHLLAFVAGALGNMSAEIINKKTCMRHGIKRVLRSLSREYIERESASCCQRLVSLCAYRESRYVCTYLSMPTELQTKPIVESVFNYTPPKSMCIPKVLGVNSEDMIMVDMPSLDALNSCEKNKWEIPEPPHFDSEGKVVDATLSGMIDLVIVPGVAFDSVGHRLGHGKGYYGM